METWAIAITSLIHGSSFERDMVVEEGGLGWERNVGWIFHLAVEVIGLYMYNWEHENMDFVWVGWMLVTSEEPTQERH